VSRRLGYYCGKNGYARRNEKNPEHPRVDFAEKKWNIVIRFRIVGENQ
jgi:hypothetical protein